MVLAPYGFPTDWRVNILGRPSPGDGSLCGFRKLMEICPLVDEAYATLSSGEGSVAIALR